MITKFETFTIGDLDQYERSDLDEILAMYQGWYEFVENFEEDIEKEIHNTIVYFKKEIPIFDKIHTQLVQTLEKKDNGDPLGMYVHESVLQIPVIFLSLDAIKRAMQDGYELHLIIRTTIFHELGHAMVDLDNQIEFIKDENVLHFEDEEEYVEDFAFEFEMWGKVPDEIVELTKLYKKYKK